MTQTKTILHFDGLCEPHNPGGVACYGWLIRQDGQVLAQGQGIEARGRAATNNVAEYAALLAGLQALLDAGLADEPVEVRGDSQLVINQMTGRWRINSQRLWLLHQRAKGLARQFTRLTWRWVPREENEEADALSRVAYWEAGGSKR